jgi:hypothetical protein
MGYASRVTLSGSLGRCATPSRRSATASWGVGVGRADHPVFPTRRRFPDLCIFIAYPARRRPARARRLGRQPVIRAYLARHDHRDRQCCPRNPTVTHSGLRRYQHGLGSWVMPRRISYVSLLAAISAALTGCVQTPWPVLRAQLDGMKGQPAKTAIDRLGYPSSEGTVAGEKFYIWSASFSQWMPSLSTTTGVGMAGGVPFSYGQTSIGGGQTIELDCTIRIFVSSSDAITHGDFRGNVGGCAPYAQRLDPSYRSGL